MVTFEELQPKQQLSGIRPNELVTIVQVESIGDAAVELTYRTADNQLFNQLLYRADEERIELVTDGRPWSFDGDGANFRLVSEAQRLRFAHLFDPLLAVHSSNVDPLPHQITAVYEEMLPRQPLRFLLADDPGAGKTIMAGLLIKELIARGDLKRCLIVCPGSLVEQWQDELRSKFQLQFDILTRDQLTATASSNWFLDTDLAIARLDQLARNEQIQRMLEAPEADWDLIVCDEAHKMSASVFGREISYTKRHRLGQLLSQHTRHFLLMTATPHNGKEADFQLFLSLLDEDRFAGIHRSAVEPVDASDLMRRMVKENLLKFDGKPLFPERIAHTVRYELTEPEQQLYEAVTNYVREEFNRAEQLNSQRRGTVGFALTVLQRRLASSPEAILRSLQRRRDRLQARLDELDELETVQAQPLDSDDLDDLDALEDLGEDEFDTLDRQILDQATAARTKQELSVEIATLERLERLALGVKRSGDTKWEQLTRMLSWLLDLGAPADEANAIAGSADETATPSPSAHQKIVIFTEHRDTLTYLETNIAQRLLGRPEAVEVIHGSMNREARRDAMERFLNDPTVQVLLATDAASEGINLQRAHLMVNYDLPWNPNRIEQRFGRIHRIGQREVCHLWNLVAEGTREGDVYHTLLAKLDEARRALGGQVFDVLGKLEFGDKSLRNLLIEAIRYGEHPDVRDRLNRVVADAIDQPRLYALMHDEALTQEIMDAARVNEVREEMERAEASRLQPHYIESFFREAFTNIGGQLRKRESQRLEVTLVPARARDRAIATGSALVRRYERITFEKDGVAGPPRAQFVAPGHPLLDATIDLTIQRHRNLLRQGAILVDERDDGTEPRLVVYAEHAVQDGTMASSNERRSISKRMLYVEVEADGTSRELPYAPYLDYRPLLDDEPSTDEILAHERCQWITRDVERMARMYLISKVAPAHLEQVKPRQLRWVRKTQDAVRARLNHEIAYLDARGIELQEQEQAGKLNARLNSQQMFRRAEDLRERYHQRIQELSLQEQIVSAVPNLIGGMVIVPIGFLNELRGQQPVAAEPSHTTDKQAVAAAAREIVMQAERKLGWEPTDVEFERRGYDIESCDPRGEASLRFIEVKGRHADAEVITVTKNEILTSLNTPEQFILALVAFRANGSHELRYLREPFQKEPDFGVTSVNYHFGDLWKRASPPS